MEEATSNKSKKILIIWHPQQIKFVVKISLYLAISGAGTNGISTSWWSNPDSCLCGSKKKQ